MNNTTPYIHRNDFNRDVWFKAMGAALTILLNSDRKTASIGTIGAFVMPFAKLNQIHIFYGYNNYPSAYMTWGYVTDDCLQRLRKHPDCILDIDELNAGANLVIFDILSNLRDITPVIRKIRELSDGSPSSVNGVRYNKKSWQTMRAHLSALTLIFTT